MDGLDNDVRTGMGIIDGKWTLEAWIKGDDNTWKPEEAIITGGEYSDLNSCDNMPLIIKDGYLYSKGANLKSSIKMDDAWHHVAVSCDGRTTRLFLDGKEVAHRDTALAILPGAIGVNEKKHTFGGSIDEVRIWRTALPLSTLQRWKDTPIERTHPSFRYLIGYYNFEDFTESMSVNWVGKGHQSYHLRNGRNDYYGNKPMAFVKPQDDLHIVHHHGKQKLFHATVLHNEWDLEQGSKGGQFIKLRIIVQGTDKPLSLDQLELDLSAMENLKDIDKVHLYYTGQQPKSSLRQEIFGRGQKAESKLRFIRQKGEPIQYMQPGVNYFLVALDLTENAIPGNKLVGNIPIIQLSGKKHSPELSTDYATQRVAYSNGKNNDIIKVLQWNIWHGGVHLGKTEGRNRVIDLIRASQADIITMQEGYGAQDTIAQALGFHLQTKSAKDNLALFSRFPIDKIPSSESFKSNPGIIKLNNGKKILVNDCWLRYAYRPEYTSSYASYGLNPKVWEAEDATLSLVDITNLINKDILPHQESPDMPTIIAGDFNSCSHLDWTDRTKPLHFGYGAVNFPTSQYMATQGFKDSFREQNPDELKYQGGTTAVIYGQMQMSRIDFIYYKGKMRTLSSKIVRSSPDIDDVWASDHAAVLTTFQVL